MDRKHRVPNRPGEEPERTPNNPVGPLPENDQPVDEPVGERQRRDSNEDREENLV
jgi:hypothetical protein